MTGDGDGATDSPPSRQHQPSPRVSVEAPLDHHQEELLATLAKLRTAGDLSPGLSDADEAGA
jgi:hypothetical protein